MRLERHATAFNALISFLESLGFPPLPPPPREEDGVAAPGGAGAGVGGLRRAPTPGAPPVAAAPQAAT